MKVKLFTLVTAFFVLTQFANATTTYYVRSPGGSNDNDGSINSPFLTLSKVFSGTPVLIDGDVINISGTFDYNESKMILVSITIQGTDKTTAIIQGTAAKLNCFRVGNGISSMPTITIENVTFQNMDYFDDASSFTGGVINVFAGSTLTCKNVNFLSNRSYIGGAINLADANASFEDCYFYNNKSAKAGTKTNADGGAINYTTTIASSLMINRCLFENNSSYRLGSALRFKSDGNVLGSHIIQNSTFTGNNANIGSPSAGAIYIEGTNTTADCKLINNTIAYNSSSNTTSTANAGLYIGGTTNKVTLLNNILFSNTNSSPASVSISNATNILLKESRNNITDLAYNWATKTTSGATMASGNTSSIVNGTSAGQLGLAVNAAALADNGGTTKTLAIGANSVAKNTGYTTGAPLVDQRNFTRIGNPDVGAYEYVVNLFRSKANGNWGDNTSWECSGDNSTWANASSTPTSPDGLVNIINGHEITVATNATSPRLTISSGGKLTLNDTKTLAVTGNFAIQSDGTNGTGTFVDINTAGGLTVSGTKTVQQYLSSAATGLTGRNWYISSPLSAASSSAITSATGNGLVYYNVGGASWDNADATMDVMKGYIAKSPAQNTTITFSGGNLNTGTQSITNLPVGFNLVGNPYPSYVNWADATKLNVTSSIWYRSKKSGSYNFHTYNVNGGVGVNDGTDIIPPMQSFWVKTTNATNSLEFTNAMLSHQNQSVVANRLKAPKANMQKLLRLQVSNGTNSDEAVVYFNASAQNAMDEFDTQKIFNNIADVPEIYTMINADKLVINGMTQEKLDTEIPLGFSTLEANNFSIKASEFKNFDTTTKIILKDNQTNIEQDLTDGTIYTFNSDPTTTTSRFSLIFKSKSVTTEINNIENANAFLVYKTSNGYISVNSSNGISGQATATVYNVSGQKLESKSIVSTKTLFNKNYTLGVYLVSITANGTTTTQKVVIN